VPRWSISNCLLFFTTANGRIETYDGFESYGEDRWATIGLVSAAKQES
jgi:uncharacterized DUF497 family protein